MKYKPYPRRKFSVKQIWFSLCLFLLFVLMIPTGVLSHQTMPEKTIRVAIPAQQEIYNQNDAGSIALYTKDYLYRVSQYTNWRFEFVEFECDQSRLKDNILNMLENGTVDLIGFVPKTSYIAKQCDLTSHHYGLMYTAIFVLTENNTISDIDDPDFNDVRIAVLASDDGKASELANFLSLSGTTYTLVNCSSKHQQITMLQNGEVDAILGTNTCPPPNTRMIAKFNGTHFYFATPKGHTAMQKQLSAAMQKVELADPHFIANLNQKYFFNQPHTLVLNKAEKEYIARNPILNVLTVDGAAPIQYVDQKGQLQGISRRVLDEIADMTGLTFTYHVADSLESALKHDQVDLYCGVPYNYAAYSMPDLILSRPYLKSLTILFMRSTINVNDLDDKIYAAVKGGPLPPGVKPEQVVYFNTREESLNAVNDGKVDYGYGNAYSVAYYMLKNEYKNIVTIPQEIESREYCMGVNEENRLLLSIINKSISVIDEDKMHNLILEATTMMSKQITLPMILNVYGDEITVIILLVLIILIIGIVFYVRANIRLKMLNKRYEVLSEIANEYFCEYNIKNNKLKLSSKLTRLFKNPAAVIHVQNIIKTAIVDVWWNRATVQLYGQTLPENNDCHYIIKLPVNSGETRTFKVISAGVNDDRGQIMTIIGKLIDISEQEAEKEALVAAAKKDGLTGLYNATASKELIIERMQQKDPDELDALLLLDLDLFKNINDQFGHYIGDQVLQDFARDLKAIFTSVKIIGRMGGDEFCVYLQDVPTMDFLRAKCRQLNERCKTVGGIKVSISIGIALIKQWQPFEEIYQNADSALYQAKDNGRGQFVFYGSESGI